ncbi:MAG: biotin--[acetyl-CoA-carboxylase] ligase [Holosporaceae bacterium]|nr:biotin--[acetyl-CoA-carboxylase] ligase [Holosporaceae bacterium]
MKLQTADSTHKFAIRLIEDEKAEELAIVAEKQTSGIGKCGRSWESPGGNLYVSVIQKLLWHRDPGQLSLTVAAAVHKVISRYISDDLYLHWPNDIHYKESKIAGILIAVVNSWMVISIGVNVNSTPDIARAVSIKDVSEVGIISIDCMLKGILTELDMWFDGLRVRGFLFVKNHWLRYACEVNRKITVKDRKGLVNGLFVGIDDFGRLILRKHGRDLFISSGDMFLRGSGES